MTRGSAEVLGVTTEYPDRYSPTLLVSIPRAASREALGLNSLSLPFEGVDRWTAYEISWLDDRGKPMVAIGEFTVPCTSLSIIESKSLKLYLNSLNQASFDSAAQLQQTLEKDLGNGFGAGVAVELFSLDQYRARPLASYSGFCLDSLDVECRQYTPAMSLLQSDPGTLAEETLYSHLLKTNCPVTGQPDWASIVVNYSGAKIDREGLLRYLVSFRQHQDFHEHCLERIFMDIHRQCRPQSLEVFARYTRRGGLDINPCRSTGRVSAESSMRTVRQ